MHLQAKSNIGKIFLPENEMTYLDITSFIITFIESNNVAQLSARHTKSTISIFSRIIYRLKCSIKNLEEQRSVSKNKTKSIGVSEANRNPVLSNKYEILISKRSN